MTQDQLLAALKKDVRSLLVSSKHGLTPEELRRDYQSMLGYPMPLRLLGFRNVLDMVNEIPDVVHLQYQLNGSIILKAIGDETTRGIEELVSKQRDTKSKAINRRGKPVNFRISYQRFQPPVLPRRGQAKPALPAQLRSQLKQLLSHGPVRLSELESRYMAQFGKPLQVTQYGFYSISEMLSTAMDFIIMQQSRTGSQLLLRNTLMPQNPKGNLIKCLSKQSVSSKQKLVEFSPKASSPSEEIPKVSKLESVKEEQSFEETILKLEEELRQQILEKGTAGTVSQELKDKLRKVVAENGNGISIHNLPTEYKRMYDEELPVSQCGFLSVTEMVGALSDTLAIQRVSDKGENHWMVMEFKPIDTQPCEPEPELLSPSHGANSIPRAKSQISPSRAFYFSCNESAWEHKETDQLTESPETDAELKATNKTIDQMVNPLQELVVNRASAIPLDAVRSQKLKPPIHRMERELLPVLVEKSESPSYFYIRFSQNKEARALENMMIEMRSCYSYPDVAERYRLPDAYVRPGQVCCVALRGMWFYRVVIHEVFSETEVKVYYVDYGDKTKVERHSLRFLKACYADLPAQAVPAMLAGVRPITSIWTESATSCFQRLCGDRTLVAGVHSYQEDFLLLFLCDTNTEEDVYVHLRLIQEGHALPCSSYGPVSEKFNPVTSYFGYGQLDDVKECLSPSSCSPDAEACSQGNGSPSSCQARVVSSSESGETNFSPIDVNPNLDLPPLEVINVPNLNTAAKSEKVNPFEDLQSKDPLFNIEWDQGWTAENKTDKMKLQTDIGTNKSKPGTVSAPSPVHEAVSSKPKPISTRCASPQTPVLNRISCSYPGVPVYPVQPPLSHFMRQLFSSPVYQTPGSNYLFQHHTSPLALRPAARMSAGANILP